MHASQFLFGDFFCIYSIGWQSSYSFGLGFHFSRNNTQVIISLSRLTFPNACWTAPLYQGANTTSTLWSPLNFLSSFFLFPPLLLLVLLVYCILVLKLLRPFVPPPIPRSCVSQSVAKTCQLHIENTSCTSFLCFDAATELGTFDILPRVML